MSHTPNGHTIPDPKDPGIWWEIMFACDEATCVCTCIVAGALHTYGNTQQQSCEVMHILLNMSD